MRNAQTRLSVIIRLVIQILVVSALLSCQSGDSISHLSDSSDLLNSPNSYLFPQQFHTIGNQFVDDQGNQVTFHGVAIVDPLILASGERPELGVWEEELFETIHNWGADIVRLPIHPPNFRDIGENRTLEILEQAVQWAEKSRLYIIIDFHGLGFPPDGTNMVDWAATDEQETIEFWKCISGYFAGNRIVAFYELYNEPGRETSGRSTSTDWLIWKTFCENVIDVIREKDPDKIILVGALNYGNNLYHARTNPVNRPNVGYTCHPYPGQSRWITWDDAFGRTAEEYPVILTEFGFENHQTEDQLINEASFAGPGRYRDELMKYTENRGIGWVAWVFSDQWTPRLLDGPDYKPSEFGEFVQKKLMEYSIRK